MRGVFLHQKVWQQIFFIYYMYALRLITEVNMFDAKNIYNTIIKIYDKIF